MTDDISFEKAFERLDTILQTMNDAKVSLDDSLKLFEEANFLIKTCNEKLVNAEQKIEKLMKDRNNQLEIENNKPKTENFTYSKDKILED
ncbi:MAG: Exodeoxyribonuclease 7 small subunit [Candidatus Anoxychlamydiales bacterium]|nr:Exodeoxyribonuclease 7 small subunit [Candidatus Anoxychlamydiales bacterium]